MDSQVVKEASEKAVCQKIDIQYKADWKEKDTESSYVPIAIQMTDLPYNHVNLTYVDTTGKRRTKVEEAHKTSRKYIADKALQGAALEIWMLIPKQNMLISQEDIKKERKKTWKPYKGPMLAASHLVIVGTVVRRLASCHHRSRLLLPRVSSSQVLSFVTSRLAVALLLSLSTSTQYLC
ncbi:hypothetical protein ACOSP7_024196 [Xanthoceras sorbifolium]